ncbi:MepB family protein [Bacteroidota bacterium]
MVDKDGNFTFWKDFLYDKLDFKISNFQKEKESQEYNACRYNLNALAIISRTSKITPKKIGQFVTFWKREETGLIAPFNESDTLDFYIVNVTYESKFAQFIFPKSILIQKGIISTDNKEGKRGFRVYPNWDHPKSKQAVQTQKWQLDYFIEINNLTNHHTLFKLYQNR